MKKNKEFAIRNKINPFYFNQFNCKDERVAPFYKYNLKQSIEL